MARKTLTNKPLVEAILEVKWSVPPTPAENVAVASISGDPHYRLLLGRFSERVQAEYPSYEPLQAAQVPDGLISHVAQHRFRTSNSSWPLIQIGHGLMTINDTAGYTWQDFRGRCESAFNMLYESHPSKADFHIQELALVYIDAIKVDFNEESVFEFLGSKMKTDVSLPDSLFADDRVKDRPLYFQWQTGFQTLKPAGRIGLKFAMGQSGQTPAVILETRMFSQNDQIPTIPEGISHWLDDAHDLTGDWFFKLIDGELLERFS